MKLPSGFLAGAVAGMSAALVLAWTKGIQPSVTAILIAALFWGWIGSLIAKRIGKNS